MSVVRSVSRAASGVSIIDDVFSFTVEEGWRTEADDEEVALEKWDYVIVKATGEQGRIVAPGITPGTGRVRVSGRAKGDQEKEVAEDGLEPVY